MSEKEERDQPEPVIDSEGVTSRFGDKNHLKELLLGSEARLLGSIDELLEVDEHMNRVELAELAHSIIESEARNHLHPVFLGREGGRAILGVFKPLDGENPDVRNEYHIDRFDIREVLAYELSEHFGFDLVPPTVHREIDGQIGSLQLFLPQDHYQTAEWVEGKSGRSHVDFGRESSDWQEMAIFDYIIGNPDRHSRNIMVRYSRNDKKGVEVYEDDYGAQLIAIDNGTSLSSKGYYEPNVPLKGPNADMTYSFEEYMPLVLKIPEYLLEMIKNGLNRREELSLGRYDGCIESTELEAMWQRAEDLVSRGVFLSRFNERHVFER